MTVAAPLADEVRRRASNRCEYCRMLQSLQGATFHIEHIIPACHGGATTLDNLALACPGCNLHKAARLGCADPDTGDHTPLFHPRRDLWSDHFAWNGYVIEGKSAIGRGTIAALQLNHSRRVVIRNVEASFGLFFGQEE